MTKLSDFPAIPCPTCNTTIKRPREWGFQEYNLVWYYCKKCKDWTTQNLRTAQELSTLCVENTEKK